MANSLDMSLDDLIKSRNTSERGRGRPRSRGRGRGRGGNFSRRRETGIPPRGPLRVNNRSSARSVAKSFRRAKDLIWQHDLFDDSMRAAGFGIETGTKLFVSNLDVGVTNEDIKELFSEVGELKRCALHYDRHGRSNGSAEVVFMRRSDGLAAVKRYNDVQLDGKPMKIEVIGTNLGLPGPVSPRVNVIGAANGRGRRTVVMMPGTGRGAVTNSVGRGFGRRGRGGFKRGGRGGRGRGRGRGRKQPTEKTSDDLDKELDSYHAEAMQTS
ncbi:THO complex subunit 4D-like isoform X2 [Aristolochia californica]|uniref:THO complex subunit 4D-like isoform X2 n=1 Tax=Aristolochia californica TaxID=171875 RepID=UPI0035E22168